MSSPLLKALKTQAPIAPLTVEAEIDAKYKHFRIRMLTSMIIGYAAFYLVRKNFSMAMPVFLNELGYTKT
ncbi:MAG: glycerol-3-phosphate transporter, partial [Myxococcota bacterium]|nr:glycerol-3-phosphate transporter [Myxococcota bacterium]